MAFLLAIELHDFKVSFSDGPISSVRTAMKGSDGLTILHYSVQHVPHKHTSLTALDIHVRHTPRNLGIQGAADRLEPPAVYCFRQLPAFVSKVWARTITDVQQRSVWRVRQVD